MTVNRNGVDQGAVSKRTVTAKGNLIVGTANSVVSNLAVGNDGETLVADSSATTGLRYQGNFAAGKNKIINGDFGVWQRGTSFSNPALFAYNADRFYAVANHTGGTITISRQTFTPGTAPVAGYEGQYYFRSAGSSPTGASYNTFGQKIENVQTFAGQTLTISFWAKADIARSVTPNFFQNFGSGGSTEVGTGGSAISLTTSWARYSQTFSLPSISGKTIGTSSYLAFEISQPLNVSHTIDYWGVQVEAGSVATAFQTATGTIQGELAACQRYYWRTTPVSNAYTPFGSGSFSGSTNFAGQFVHPVPMRTEPTLFDFSNLAINDTATVIAITGASINNNGTKETNVNLTVASGGTQYRYGRITANNTTSAYAGFGAEL